MSKYYTDRYGRVKQKGYIVEILFLFVIMVILSNIFIQSIHPCKSGNGFVLRVEHSGTILED